MACDEAVIDPSFASSVQQNKDTIFPHRAAWQTFFLAAAIVVAGARSHSVAAFGVAPPSRSQTDARPEAAVPIRKFRHLVSTFELTVH